MEKNSQFLFFELQTVLFHLSLKNTAVKSSWLEAQSSQLLP